MKLALLLLGFSLLMAQAASAQELSIGIAVVDTMHDAEQRLTTTWDNVLLAYVKQEQKMAVLQGEIAIGQGRIDDIRREYEARLQQAPDDASRKAILQEARMELSRVPAPVPSGAQPGAMVSRKPSPLCSLLKDGRCEATCPQPDLDCQCGNSKCESYENRDTCPADCRSPRNYLCTIARDNFCDRQCPGFDIDCEVVSLIDTTIGYYQKDEDFYTQAMTALSIIMVLLLGIGMWLVHDIYNIKFGKP